jgi:hypothetical protein
MVLEKMYKIGWTDCVRKEKYYVESRKGGRSILYKIKRRKPNWIGHVLQRNCCLKHATERQIKRRI